MISTSGLSYCTCWIIQILMFQRAKMRFLAIFLSSVHRIGLILHILIELNGLHALASVSLMLDVSKTTKMPILNDPNSILAIFLSLDGEWVFLAISWVCLLDWLDIAYCERTKYCAWLAHCISCVRSLKSQHHFEVLLTTGWSEARLKKHFDDILEKWFFLSVKMSQFAKLRSLKWQIYLLLSFDCRC